MNVATNYNNFSNISSLMEAARQRNGFNGASEKVSSGKKITETSDFLSSLKKITTAIVEPKQQMSGEKTVTPAVFPKIQSSEPVQPKKILGNYIDLMA